MYRFFVEEEQLNNSPVIITGSDYNHIKNVLRLKIGEHIFLCDGGNKEYECVIENYNTDSGTVEVSIVDIFSNVRELPARIVLFQGYPKGDKMEQIVQKAVELGVEEIIPVMMKRCVVKFDEKKAEKKVGRLNEIALSAAKQSKRGKIPKVKPIMSMKQAVEYAKDIEHIVLPYENAKGIEYAKSVIESASQKKSIAVFIGPEGGFEDSEVMLVEGIGGQIITLGNRILRTETAGMVVLSLLMFELENNNKNE